VHFIVTNGCSLERVNLKLVSHHKRLVTINKHIYWTASDKSRFQSERYWSRKPTTYSFKLALFQERFTVYFSGQVRILSAQNCSDTMYCISILGQLEKVNQRTSVLSTYSRMKGDSTKLYYTIVSQQNRNWKVLSLPCISTNKTERVSIGVTNYFTLWQYFWRSERSHRKT